MKHLTIIMILLSTITPLVAQEFDFKKRAIEAFKNENYDEAITILERALTEVKDDAEIYYYLGFFNHYRAYDSRPLTGYDFSYSEKVFHYLDQAIELKPNYGDAKYFYGAECSANAMHAMQVNDAQSIKHFYELAYSKGAYPDWLIEFGKNMLNACDNNAILFASGNVDFDIGLYLQLLQNYRTDITLIPIGNIDRPWYVKFLKQGLEGSVRGINLNLSDDQIYDMHPYKWKSTEIKIPVSPLTLKNYDCEESYEMIWTVEADLTSNRQHSKMEDEDLKNRTYLSPQRAILLQIVEDNFKERPIYFSKLSNQVFLGGLDDYLKDCGLVSELTPMKTAQTKFKFDYTKIEQLLNAGHFSQYATILTTNIPRISGIVFSYHHLVLLLAEYYLKNGEKEKQSKLRDFYIQNLAIGFNETYEELIVNEIDK